MADPENQVTPRADVEAILAEFDAKKDLLQKLSDKTKVLLEELLENAQIRFQSVQARVKTREKLRTKYLDERKDYRQLNDITDQVALRVITYYEDEVDRVADVVKAEFEIDVENSVDKRETEPDKFGYYALNYVCGYSNGRVSQAEYKKFASVSFEIQIISILRHGWSEIEHPWYDLQRAYPDHIKRRFARMAALLEIAETEFLSLRKARLDYQQSIAVQVEAKLYDLPVDAVSLRTFIEQDSLVSEIDKEIASLRGREYSKELSDRAAQTRARGAILAGMTKLQDVRNLLAENRARILEFTRQVQNVSGAGRSSEPLEVGVCVWTVSLLLVSTQSTVAIASFSQAFNFGPKAAAFAQLMGIAKDVMTRK